MSKEAERRIQKALELKAVWLNLSGCTSKTLPQSLKKLINLKVLRLNNNKTLYDLSPLAELKNLSAIYANDTRVSDLSPLVQLTELNTLDLSNTQVRDLNPLSKLRRLNTLDLSNTQVRDLSLLAQLSNLITLNLSNTKVNYLNPLIHLSSLIKLDLSNTQVSDLNSLAQLRRLNTLDLSNTQVSDLSPLVHLSNLITLDLSNTHLSNLNPLVQLKRLNTLDLSNTQVNDLTPLKLLIEKGIEVINKEQSIKNGIYIKNCPINNPPLEIIEQGNEAILRYWEEKERLEKTNQAVLIKVREAKLLIVGQGKSGKTTLRYKLEDSSAPMPSQEDTTLGIEITRLQEKMPHTGEDLYLNIWDFGGQEIQRYAHQFFLTGSSLYAIVTNERIQDTVHLPYWLNIIEMLGKKSPVVLVQNKDSGHWQALKDEAAIRARFGNVYHKVFQSDFSQAVTEREFAELRQTLVEQASKLPHVERDYLRSFHDLRLKLEAQTQSEKHYLSWGEYLQLMPELSEELMMDYANALTFLGVCQYFPEDSMLANYVFLRPKWLIDALFELLLHPEIKHNRGHFTESDTRRVWVRSEYRGMHSLLVRMMKQFELCYRVEGDEEKYIIPQLLPIAEESYGWGYQEGIPVQYCYKFMPKGILTRLICRMHPRIEKDPELGQRVWNDAVIFTLPDGKGHVFAREVYSENTIELRSTGVKHAEMLNEVIRKMDDINRDTKYNNLKVEKLVPCPCPECARSESPGFHTYDAILKRIEKGKNTSECKKSGEDVLINEIFGKSGVKKPNSIEENKDKSTFNIFISCSKADRDYLYELEKQLKPLQKKYNLGIWYDHKLLAGSKWDDEIRSRLRAAKVILFLLSPDFLATQYIQDVEITMALERHEQGECRVVPILLQPCLWETSILANLSILPTTAKPISTVRNRVQSWVDVVKKLQEVFETIKS